MLASPNWFWDQSFCMAKTQGQGTKTTSAWAKHTDCSIHSSNCIRVCSCHLPSAPWCAGVWICPLCCLPATGCKRLSWNGSAFWHRFHTWRSYADADPEGPGEALHHPHRQLLRQQGIYRGFEALKTSVATTFCAVLLSVDTLFYYYFVGCNKVLQVVFISYTIVLTINMIKMITIMQYCILRMPWNCDVF